MAIVDRIRWNAKQILIYIDPGFRLGRHYVNMAETISAECDSRSVPLLHYVGEHVPDSIAARYRLLKIFKNGARPPEESKSQFAGDLRALLDDLIKSVGLNTKLIFYMYCGLTYHFVAISELVSLSQYQDIDMKFYVNLSYQDMNCGKSPHDYAVDLKFLSDLLDSKDKSDRIVGIMDSQQSIKRYQSCFNRRLKLAPIPLYHQRPCAKNVIDNHKPLIIGYFGQLVEEQGYVFATQVYEEFIEKRNHTGVKFLMRVNSNKSLKQLANHFEDFRKKTNRIRIVEGFVETDKYLSMIAQCDVVILPYLKECYPYRTSGVFVDALVHNKVVVVPRETWMSEMITKYGAGCTFRSGDLASLVSAVDRVIVNYSSYAASASRNITGLYSLFSARSLLDLMCGEQCLTVRSNALYR
jgi:glycosyltransferase involved in cell wall biosynthesis